MVDERSVPRDGLFIDPGLNISVDISSVRLDNSSIRRMSPVLGRALESMRVLEAGAIANTDERRMVGHYWLRSPELAPAAAITGEIRAAQDAVARFARGLHDGSVAGAAGTFLDVLHVGIGGSALGPQLLCDVLGEPAPDIAVHFLDNADPDGIDRVLRTLRGGPGRTLVSVVSKSGLTPTPMLVMQELSRVFEHAAVDMNRQAVATTMAGSDLDVLAREQGWLARFPLWDWVGGRTSVTSAVGLLPAAVARADIVEFLDGAAAMDRCTRGSQVAGNPAALLALAWYWLGAGRGEKNMVILPYKDRLARFPRYVQQLVMESLGKRLDRAGRVVQQGLTVYGHKGSTDQHAYLQQLRDGRPDSFITFIGVRRERDGVAPAEVKPGLTLGDYLFANMEGTRKALDSAGRESITIMLPDLSARTLGALIALYERAVGLYAELVDVNAYHQPGVDKFAAASTIELQRAVLAFLRECTSPCTAQHIATAINADAGSVWRLLANLSAAGSRGLVTYEGTGPQAARFVLAKDPKFDQGAARGRV
jgi:glucose-6-phosphate isomerase